MRTPHRPLRGTLEHHVVRNGLSNTDAGTEHNKDEGIITTSLCAPRKASTANAAALRARPKDKFTCAGGSAPQQRVNHQAGDDSRQSTGNQQHAGVHGR